MNTLFKNTQQASTDFIQKYFVIIFFCTLSILAFLASGLSVTYIVQEMLTRLGRNAFLVLALLIPIYAGMGLNFALALGAMAGQIGLIYVVNLSIGGATGLAIAALISLPIAILLGVFSGFILNKARGREMVTGFILAYFINGVYQFVVLYLMGTLFPIQNKAILLSRGYGIRNTLDLDSVRGTLDHDFAIHIGNITLPTLSYILIILLCLFILYFKKTKLGHDMRSVGFNNVVAQAQGLNVNKLRIIAMCISTVLAAFGQIIFLQNIGNIATYNAHDQTSFFAVAAILVGGASIKRASIANVFIGVILLHLLFVVSPLAGKNIFGNAAIGEYFRQFIGFCVIAVSLVIYAMQESSAKKKLAQI